MDTQTIKHVHLIFKKVCFDDCNNISSEVCQNIHTSVIRYDWLRALWSSLHTMFQQTGKTSFKLSDPHFYPCLNHDSNSVPFYRAANFITTREECDEVFLKERSYVLEKTVSESLMIFLIVFLGFKTNFVS